MGDILVEINSDKATLELPADAAGKIQILAEEDATVEIGAVIAKIGVASPSAEKMMKDKGIDAANVAGSGRDGRVTKADVVNHKESAPAPKADKPAAKQEAPASPTTLGGSRETRREKMSMMRRSIASRLVAVKNETAMLTTFNEVDMTAIKSLRTSYKEKFKEKYGVGLGFMGFFCKAVTEAMNDFPGVNAQIDGKEVIYHDYVDVGIAVSTERGLVVPVIRNVESMSILQVEQSIRAYALKARENKITIDDMTGGTFSITNGGVFGSMLSTPIINPPQSAILGMHNIVDRPMAVNGNVEIRPIMYVALSYDHRIVDGKEAVSFLYKVKEYLEDPTRLLFGV
ncbi:UNVERIFIED_CONTAM: hypothetical protein GTU68_061126 [Idotea baltica]|nr:hypothetical protein [Idotea baltica]